MSSRTLLVAIALGVAGLFAENAGAQESSKLTVVRSFPHDQTAFTEGLVLFEGKLYESTGLEGRSTLQRADIATGKVEKKIELDPSLFGEGLARIDRRLYQLTWKSGVAIEYDLDTFVERRRFPYAGEGWGLCYDGEALVMSNGTSRLAFRDPETFGEIRSVQVLRGGQALANINELECVEGQIYANIWQTDLIVVIDARTGKVTSEINAAGLLSANERRGVDVLNGIAFIPASRTFYLTGKYWPKVFEVSFSGTPKAPAGVPAKVPPGAKIGCSFPSGRAPFLPPGAYLAPIAWLAWVVRRQNGRFWRHATAPN